MSINPSYSKLIDVVVFILKALQMLLTAEKKLKNVKILAITCVDGNTTVENVVKNTYHILHQLNRTDVSIYRKWQKYCMESNHKKNASKIA